MQGPERAPRADDMTLARAWRDDNREGAYAQIVKWAIDAKRRCVSASIGFMAEALRNPHMFRPDDLVPGFRAQLESAAKVGPIVRGDSPYLINHNIRSCLVRLIEEDHPELRGVFRKRRSRFDEPSAPNARPRHKAGV